jgi:hypothetical protein
MHLGCRIGPAVGGSCPSPSAGWSVGDPRGPACSGRRSRPGGRLAVTELLARVGGSSVTANCPRLTKEAAISTWLWVLIIVVVLVLVFGVMRRRGR